MNKIILKIEVGDWDGGHNGQFPKIIEWDLTDEQYPLQIIEGWGHGLGGGRLSFESEKFKEMEFDSSSWAYKIISISIESKLSLKEIGEALSFAYKRNKPEVPSHLAEILEQWGYL